MMEYFLARNLHIYDSLGHGKNSEAIILKYPSNYRQCDSSWSVEPSNRLSEITPLLCIYTCIIKLNCLPVIIISQKNTGTNGIKPRERDRQTDRDRGAHQCHQEVQQQQWDPSLPEGIQKTASNRKIRPLTRLDP